MPQQVDLKEWQKLKAVVDAIQREADQATGARNNTMQRLMVMYNVTTIAEAEAVAKQKEADAVAAEQAYADALNDFNLEWGHVLGQLPQGG